MSTTYQPGEHVRVTIDARVDVASPAGTLLFLTLLDGAVALQVDATASGVSVARVAPADGVPQPGELWADQLGTEWFAVSERGGYGVCLHAVDGRAHPWREIHSHVHLGPIRRVRPATPVATQDEKEAAR